MKKVALLASLALLSVTGCHRQSESVDTQNDYAVPDDQPSPAATPADEEGNHVTATPVDDRATAQAAHPTPSGSPATAH